MIPGNDVFPGELRNGDDVISTTSRPGNQGAEIEILGASVKLRMAFKQNVMDRGDSPAAAKRWEDVLSMKHVQLFTPALEGKGEWNSYERVRRKNPLYLELLACWNF